MKTITKGGRMFRVAAVVSILVSVSLGALLVAHGAGRVRRDAEFHAWRVLTGVMERYATDPDFNPESWKDLRGFGVYGAFGQAFVQYGTAPDVLSDPSRVPDSALVRVSGKRAVIVRRVGSVPAGHRNMMRDEGRRDRDLIREFTGEFPCPPGEAGSAAPGSPRAMHGRMGPRHGPFGRGQYVFADIDLASFIRSRMAEPIAVTALFAVLLASLALLAFYARKVSQYRESEARNAHLVEMGNAARTLAHEIKNPLGVIRVQCATLRKRIPEEFHRNVSIVDEEALRLARLADRLRDYLQNSGGSPVPVSVSDELAGLAARYDGKLSVLGDTDAYVRIDPEHLTQILDNLVSNALEASPAPIESAVNAAGDAMANAMVEVSAFRARSTVRIAVMDRGSGVAPEVRARLFSPFVTTKTRGSGIGLALAKRLTELAGGSVEWAPREGGGSVFTVLLPEVSKPVADGSANE